MDLEKDFIITSEKQMENGLYSQETEEKCLIKEKVNKLTDIIQFIL
jgi:hypothetical protein